MLKIRLTPQEFDEVKTFLSKSDKISAIKAVRRAKLHSIHVDPLTGNKTNIQGIGLREAKDAVEHYLGYESSTTTAVLEGINPIKSIKVNMEDGSGEVEVDMEQLSFKFAASINELGIKHTAKLMELYTLIENWEKSL
jgi:ribosomal protein L7/L12